MDTHQIAVALAQSVISGRGVETTPEKAVEIYLELVKLLSLDEDADVHFG